MNREAVALGVPVYTTFAGRLGAVDESLVNAGRPASSPPRTTCNSRNGLNRGARTERDPALVLDLMLTALALARICPSG